MSTDICTELSKNNTYHISKQRYLELKHRALQYDEWNKLYLKAWHTKSVIDGRNDAKAVARPTEDQVIVGRHAGDKMHVIDRLIFKLSNGNGDLSDMLHSGIKSGLTYEKMAARIDHVPSITRHDYYDNYRKFFWLYDKEVN